ncbi:MAG: hypothetical protein K8T25_23705 [Planctomycetia bacterium]|nr:hypothetical protein [Planctomycetia bacterium]
MHAILGNLSALTAAMVLALPPGLCCWSSPDNQHATSAAAAQQATQPAPSCCHKTAQPSHDGHPAPSSPTSACNCERQITSPPDTVQSPDLTAHHALTFALPLPVHSVERHALSIAVILPSGPPLHALHCVWII